MRSFLTKKVLSLKFTLIGLLLVPSLLLSGCHQSKVQKYTLASSGAYDGKFPVVFVINNETGEIKGCGFFYDFLHCTQEER